jgi:hypothetical protein
VAPVRGRPRRRNRIHRACLGAQFQEENVSNDAGSSANPPPIIRVGRLATLAHVRAELGRVYADARRKAGRNLSPSDASRLAFVLQKIGENLVAQDLAQRIEKLEELERGRS